MALVGILMNIKGKLGVDSRLQVALRARELGLVKESAEE
jgi:DNA-binding CsgD family transcriptional regulator